jgi:syntaxin-binding protein 5
MQACHAAGVPRACRQSRLHSQAAQNREALQQRGEKLSRLNERTEQMEADAMDFASMARQIAARERDRKWWQM